MLLFWMTIKNLSTVSKRCITDERIWTVDNKRTFVSAHWTHGEQTPKKEIRKIHGRYIYSIIYDTSLFPYPYAVTQYRFSAKILNNITWTFANVYIRWKCYNLSDIDKWSWYQSFTVEKCNKQLTCKNVFPTLSTSLLAAVTENNK